MRCWWTAVVLTTVTSSLLLAAEAFAQPADENERGPRTGSVLGSQAGDGREVASIKLCWCPPGRFRMGSPRDEPERRPDEAQVDVTLTKGFWMGKYEVTQGQWKRVIGKLPGEPGPSLNRATKVGSYPANPWGLHDMHGNVVEWCRDWYHQKLPGGDDPDLSFRKGTMNRDGTYSRSRRGSAWTDDGWASRSAVRQRFEPERRYDHIGFRVVVVRQ